MDTSFAWDQHFVTDLDAVDEQHHALVDLFNELSQGLFSKRSDREVVLADTYARLLSYTEHHFQEEEAWVKAQATTLAATTIQTRFVHVRQVFRAAVSDKIIHDDPTDGVTLPRRRRADAAMNLPTPAQVRAILDAADDQTHVLVALCAFAGLRLGEAVAVKASDIDFPRRQLHVQRQRQRDEVRLPKYGSERTVPLPDELVAVLGAHVREHPHPDEWLFVGERGPAQDNWAHARFRKACKAAGVAGVTIHGLRHFYASGLIAAGCDVVTVQRALGHASATTTLNIYSHLWPSAEDRTRAGAAQVMADVSSADSVRTKQPSTAV